MSSFNRYEKFKENGTMKLVPFIEIPVKNTDIYTVYEQGRSRLDLISYQYYGDPNYGWLILQANPEVSSYEFNILDKTVLRVPYPLGSTLTQYNSDIDEYDRLNGLENVEDDE